MPGPKVKPREGDRDNQVDVSLRSGAVQLGLAAQWRDAVCVVFRRAL